MKTKILRTLLCALIAAVATSCGTTAIKGQKSGPSPRAEQTSQRKSLIGKIFNREQSPTKAKASPPAAEVATPALVKKVINKAPKSASPIKSAAKPIVQEDKADAPKFGANAEEIPVRKASPVEAPVEEPKLLTPKASEVKVPFRAQEVPAPIVPEPTPALETLPPPAAPTPIPSAPAKPEVPAPAEPVEMESTPVQEVQPEMLVGEKSSSVPSLLPEISDVDAMLQDRADRLNSSEIQNMHDSRTDVTDSNSSDTPPFKEDPAASDMGKSEEGQVVAANSSSNGQAAATKPATDTPANGKDPLAGKKNPADPPKGPKDFPPPPVVGEDFFSMRNLLILLGGILLVAIPTLWFVSKRSQGSSPKLVYPTSKKRRKFRGLPLLVLWSVIVAGLLSVRKWFSKRLAKGRRKTSPDPKPVVIDVSPKPSKVEELVPESTVPSTRSAPAWDERVLLALISEGDGIVRLGSGEWQLKIKSESFEPHKFRYTAVQDLVGYLRKQGKLPSTDPSTNGGSNGSHADAPNVASVDPDLFPADPVSAPAPTLEEVTPSAIVTDDVVVTPAPKTEVAPPQNPPRVVRGGKPALAKKRSAFAKPSPTKVANAVRRPRVVTEKVLQSTEPVLTPSTPPQEQNGVDPDPYEMPPAVVTRQDLVVAQDLADTFHCPVMVMTRKGNLPIVETHSNGSGVTS